MDEDLKRINNLNRTEELEFDNENRLFLWESSLYLLNNRVSGYLVIWQIQKIAILFDPVIL